MTQVQTPKKLLEFIRGNRQKVTAFQVSVVKATNGLTRPHTHKILSDIHVSKADTPEDIGRMVCTTAYSDLAQRQGESSGSGVYRLSLRYSDRTRKSRHFQLSLETATAPDENSEPCKDCRGSGFYVGFSDRGICKTCNGTKVVSK